MTRFVAVGDIHGCAQTLAALLERLELKVGDTLLTTGDLSSKGVDSNGVHQQLVDLEAQGINLIPLLGNHELMLLAMQRFIGADVNLSVFPAALFQGAELDFLIRSNETWATLKSYGCEHIDIKDHWVFEGDDVTTHFDRVGSKLADLDWQLPQPHLDLLCRCRTHHLERNCLFVHSGIHPKHLRLNAASAAIEAQLAENAADLCWNRDWLRERPGFPELLVHGHTPLFSLYSWLDDTDPWKDDDLVFKSVVHRGALNIDSGVFLESGHLTAVEIPENGDPENMQFVRVPRLDPVEKDRLWYVRHMS